ncbi:GTP pyrophosphokinase [Streptomyces sp. YS-B37]|uniref:GTP pyrophosphokinase n=1 Tax=Streptomyces sp. YS-B37 TaxID=3407669 RepID=UPI003B507553
MTIGPEDAHDADADDAASSTTETEAAAEARYRERLALQSEFTPQLLGLVASLLKANEISVVQMEGRTKTVASVVDKMRRKGEKYRGSRAEITDLTGIRIVTYYLQDVERVVAVLSEEFTVDWENTEDRRAPEAPEEFGYESSHYIIRLDDKRAQFNEWRKFSGLTAEIQVRTVLQHAWASISHKLIYKREEYVPVPLRRSFARLSALLGVADEQFSGLARQASTLEETYTANVSSGELDLPLDPLSVQAYTNAPEVHTALAELAERGGWRLVDESSAAASVEQDTRNLLEICSALDFTTVRELAEATLTQDASKTAQVIGAYRKGHSVGISAQDLLNRLLIAHRRVPTEVFRGMYTRDEVMSLMDAR